VLSASLRQRWRLGRRNDDPSAPREAHQTSEPRIQTAVRCPDPLAALCESNLRGRWTGGGMQTAFRPTWFRGGNTPCNVRAGGTRHRCSSLLIRVHLRPSFLGNAYGKTGGDTCAWCGVTLAPHWIEIASSLRSSQ
jgi:hypothetical protein